MVSRSPGPLPTLRDQVAELRRERKMRDQVYPHLINTGKLQGGEALRRNAALDAAIKTLDRLALDLDTERERIARVARFEGR